MNVNADVVIRDVNNIPPAQDVHLIIAADVLSNQSYTVLKNLVAALKPGCFILLEETAAHLDLKTALKETDLTLAGKQIDPIGKTYLLLKKREERREPTVIQITEKNLSWLESVKAALKKSDSDGQELLLVSQGEETLGKITEKIISYFRFTSLFVLYEDQNTNTDRKNVSSLFVHRLGWTYDLYTTRDRRCKCTLCFYPG